MTAESSRVNHGYRTLDDDDNEALIKGYCRTFDITFRYIISNVLLIYSQAGIDLTGKRVCTL